MPPDDTQNRVVSKAARRARTCQRCIWDGPANGLRLRYERELTACPSTRSFIVFVKNARDEAMKLPLKFDTSTLETILSYPLWRGCL